MAKAIRRQNHPKCQYDGKCARAASHILLTKHGDFHLCTKHTKDVQEWSGVRYVEKIRPDNSKRNPHEVSFACENCNHVFTIDSDYWIPPRTYTDRYQCPKCLKKHATVVMYKIQWLKKNPGKAYHLDRFYKLDKDRLFTEFHNLHELNNRVMGAVEEAGKSARMSGATDYEVSEYRRRATRDFKGYRNPVYGYIGFYKGKQFEVYASSSLEAQTKIAKEQKVKKPWEITVVLAEKEGKPVTHLPLFNPSRKWLSACQCEHISHVESGGCKNKASAMAHTRYGKYLVCNECYRKGHMQMSNPSRKWHLGELGRLAGIAQTVHRGDHSARQFHFGEMAAQAKSARMAGAVEDEVERTGGWPLPLANPKLTKHEMIMDILRARYPSPVRIDTTGKPTGAGTKKLYNKYMSLPVSELRDSHEAALRILWENPTDRWRGRKKDHEWMIVAQQYTPSYREFYHCELCNKYEDSDGKRYTAAQFKGIMKTQELYQPDCRIRLNPLAGLGSYIVAGLGLGIGSSIAHDAIRHVKKVKSKK